MCSVSIALSHYGKDYIFSLIVFYTLSVWHIFSLFWVDLPSVKYSLVKCFSSTFLMYDLWDCISQSDSVSYLRFQTHATFSTTSQAQNFTTASPCRLTHFPTGHALKDLSYFFMFVSSATSAITFLLELLQPPQGPHISLLLRLSMPFLRRKF